MHKIATDERFRLLVESVRDYAIFMLDKQGHVLSWNAGGELIIGYAPNEIIGKHFSIFYPEEDIKAGKPELELESVLTKGRFEDEGWRVRKDGSRFWANVIVTDLRDENGKVIGFSKITRDLSERKNAEEILRESEERYRLLTEGVSDYAIFMLDPEQRVASWNKGAQRLKGYTADEIIGKHFSIFYPEEDKAKPAYEMAVIAKTGRFEDEGWRVRKDGSRFWANVVITAIKDKNGKLLGYSKITRDLTERKRAEEALRGMKEELEHTVEELRHSVDALNKEIAGRKLIEQELTEKNKQLQISNTDLEQFAYVASHDLREPLRMISNYSTLLVKHCKLEDEDSKLFSEFILGGVTHMQRLINDLLDYSRIGRSGIRFQEIDTMDVVDKVKMALSAEIDNTDAIITYNDLPVVEGVYSLITNLFQNLIANSIKFRKPGTTPRINITAQPLQNSDDWQFSIEDNGIGIPKEYQERIFVIFQRLHSRREYEGTGIGLAMCKKIVEFHGGKLWVESIPDGSRFCFTLPERVKNKELKVPEEREPVVF
jgi:PAS domain S-box-containing protein